MIELFPGNYAWSQAALRAMFVGGSAGDVLHVVELLSAEKDADPLRWYRAWRDLGDQLARRAAAARDRGHASTAAASWLRAAIYVQWSVAFLPVADSRRAAGQRRAIELYADHARMSDPPIERVEVPYERSSFPAWLVRPREGGPYPAVIYLPGWDSTKEQGSGIAAALKEREIGTLLCDGPGIGEAVARGMPNRHDYEVPGSAAFDWLGQAPGVDPRRIGVVGASLGGYRAARFAAFERRLAATVVWGAIWDFGAVWRRQLEQPGSSLPTSHDHALHVTGAATLDEVTAKLSAWTLTGVADRITSPLLILHGAADSQIRVEDAERLHAVAASKDKPYACSNAARAGARTVRTTIASSRTRRSVIGSWRCSLVAEPVRYRGMTDARERVTGTVPFTIDVELPRMLHARLLRSTAPHARIRGLDVSRARRVPGVVAVLTGADLAARGDIVPHFGPVLRDQSILAIEKVRYVGDPLVAVAAVDLDAADEALALVEVEYEELAAVFDVESALADGAPLVHDEPPRIGRTFADLIVNPAGGTNVCNQFRLRKGDAEAGFATAAHVFEDVFTSPPAQHVPMETHAPGAAD